ncbi:MAG: hypothetical protein J6M22_05805 [Firmicutes bacterium]|nr:hypothetical protein [Bacillota bacterium]
MKLFKHRDTIIMVIIMLICIFMGIGAYQEGHTANIFKWVIILGMTVVLLIRHQKKNRQR